MKTMSERRNELLREVADHVTATAADHGFPPEVSAQLGHSVADVLAESWGGQVLSFPKDLAYKTVLRDEEILAAYQAGTSVAALAKQWHMSERGIRRLIKRAELRSPNRRQRSLFEVDD